AWSRSSSGPRRSADARDPRRRSRPPSSWRGRRRDRVLRGERGCACEGRRPSETPLSWVRVGGILQQVAEGDQRVALPTQTLDQRGKILDETWARTGTSAGFAQT